MKGSKFSRFAKTANLTTLRFALDQGFAKAIAKTDELHQSVIEILYEGGTSGKNPFEVLIRLQSELKERFQNKGETYKARDRRLREGWFENYAPESQPGLDIGCQYDPLNSTFRRWDLLFGDGDAQRMDGLADGLFQTVYASHVLEHMVDPEAAVRNWYRLLRPGGHLIVSVPHRDLYEKKRTLPSSWNVDHKWFWLPDRDDPPDTLGLERLFEKANLEGSEIRSIRVADEGYDFSLPADVHPVGEFSIEAVVRRGS